MLAGITLKKKPHVGAETGTSVQHYFWFPSLHVVSPRPNTANKIRLFVKQLKISTFPVKAFWPSFVHHSSRFADWPTESAGGCLPELPSSA